MFAVSFYVLVSHVKSFQVSKAGNMSSVKGHCAGVYTRLQSSNVSFHMFMTVVPDELSFVGEKLHCRYHVLVHVYSNLAEPLMYAYTHAYIQEHTHTHTHTFMHPGTHKHTHTHTGT